MLVRKSPTRKKGTARTTNGISLDGSLTSMDWLPKIQIGENVSSSSAAPPKQALPDSTSLPITPTAPPIADYKTETTDVESPTSTVYSKPPYSYVMLIRQAIISAETQKMTLNEIYQWILDSYPYFRTALPKWKNSIRHNLSLNKCFKRLQRSSDDPGKGSYWTLDTSNESPSQANSRRRRFDATHPPPHCPNLQDTDCYPHRSPTTGSEVVSAGGLSSSADESDSTPFAITNSTLLSWDDLNADLTASFRRFREQVLDGPSTTWMTSADAPPSSSPVSHTWKYDLLPQGEANSLFENIKFASNNEFNWNDVDVKPYGEFLDGFRASFTHQQPDRDKLLNLTSSVSSFLDCTGTISIAQPRMANESMAMNHLPVVSNQPTLEPTHNLTSTPYMNMNDSVCAKMVQLAALPLGVEEEAFDWDSIA